MRVMIRLASFVSPLAVLAGCATNGPPSRSVRTSVHVEPKASAENVTPPAVPQLSSAKQPAMSAAPERRIKLLEVAPGTPIPQAVAQLASQLGMGVSIDPEVRGTTGGTLRNVTLDSALLELVGRRGYAFQVQGTVLRVVPVRMETRTFTLDYVALSRVGTMTTVVQRRLPNTVPTSGLLSPVAAAGLGVPTAGIPGGHTADVLTAQSVADIWQEIRVALTGLLQAGQPQSARAADQTATAGAVTGVYGGPGASSLAFPDGATLVISPISGLISVTAMPEKLRAVEAFIEDFQSSVLRQVMIEAKIVEVSLSKTFQFGIDWNYINSTNRSTIAVRNNPTSTSSRDTGTINFTLKGGSAEIGAVLTALESQGQVNVLSNEKTTALNNQRAIFNVTTDEVFFYVTRSPLLGPNGGVISFQNQIVPQQVSVGVVLDVLPQISADNVLTMDVRPAVTSIARVDSIALPDGTSASAPVIARREGDTIARLRAGETMVIGGLVQTRRENTTGGIPWLKDIPLLGTLFKQIRQVDNRSELVIFLTPTIVSGAPATGGAGGGR